jgi:hypothetical protein
LIGFHPGNGYPSWRRGHDTNVFTRIEVDIRDDSKLVAAIEADIRDGSGQNNFEISKEPGTQN